jgi:hypothetical protein
MFIHSYSILLILTILFQDGKHEIEQEFHLQPGTVQKIEQYFYGDTTIYNAFSKYMENYVGEYNRYTLHLYFFNVRQDINCISLVSMHAIAVIVILFPGPEEIVLQEHIQESKCKWFEIIRHNLSFVRYHELC